MKISKLFHWIYALLMLLPFAFFVPSLFYYAFNDNASMNSVEVPVTETIAVDFNQKLSPIESVSNSTSLTYTISNDYQLILNGTASNSNLWINSDYSSENVLFTLVKGHKYLSQNLTLYTFGSVALYFDVYDVAKILVPNDDYPITAIRSGWITGREFTNYVWSLNLFDLTEMYGEGNEPTISQFFNVWGDEYPYPYVESKLIQITYDTGETQTLATNVDMISNAWDSIWDLPLFNWCKVTFVAVPFTFITGLFGIGANSTLNYAFGYFLSISICWLVFDVIMYVPMLVHRWIDKARIE